MPALSVRNLWKSFDSTPALRGLSFDIQPGEIVALLGPSGCGKSTVLNVIAGLIPPDRGELIWEGESLAGIPPHRRNFGLMFQDYALFPHLNVAQNIGFGLQMAGNKPAQVHKRILEVLALVGLEGFEARDVNTLSGGEAQRVALARSLAPQPRFLMLDEPLGALDRALRERLTVDLRHILRRLGQTALYVTHDQEEAFSLADRVVLLDQGQVAQAGTPQQLYRYPASPFVSRFLGLDNLLEAWVIDTPEGSAIETTAGILPLAVPAQGKLTILLRPDAFALGGTGSARLNARLLERTFHGSVCRVLVQAGLAKLSFDLPGFVDLPPVGDEIVLGYVPEQAIHVFPEDHGLR